VAVGTKPYMKVQPRGTLTCQIIMQQILLFYGEKKTYTSLLGPKRLLISDSFPSKPDFHLHK
jgi:hypothetical protein